MSHQRRTTCPICGGGSLRQFHTFNYLSAQPQFARFQAGEGPLTAEAEREPVLICANCNALVRALIIDYDQVHNNYRARHADQDAEAIARHLESEYALLSDPGYVKYRREKAILKAALPTESRETLRILDIGSREGVLARALRAEGLDVRVVEPTSAFTSVLQARFGVPCTTALFGPELFPPESFDLISALHVLHRADDPAAFIGAAVRQLRPNGALVLAVNSLYDLSWAYMTQQHRVLYTPSSITQLLERHGLSVRSIEPVIWDGTARQIVVATKASQPSLVCPPPDDPTKMKTAVLRAEFGLLSPIRGSFAGDRFLLTLAQATVRLLGRNVVPGMARLLRMIDRRIGCPEPALPKDRGAV